MWIANSNENESPLQLPLCIGDSWSNHLLIYWNDEWESHHKALLKMVLKNLSEFPENHQWQCLSL